MFVDSFFLHDYFVLINFVSVSLFSQIDLYFLITFFFHNVDFLMCFKNRVFDIVKLVLHEVRDVLYANNYFYRSYFEPAQFQRVVRVKFYATCFHLVID